MVKRGFTLLEMMVVVAVVGVVAALGVLAVSTVIGTAKKRDAVEVLADQLRELRDRAQSTGGSVLLFNSGVRVGIGVSPSECTALPAACATATTNINPPAGQAAVQLTEGFGIVNPFGMGCISASGATFYSFLGRFTCTGFVSSELHLRLTGPTFLPLPTGPCSDCVVARKEGMIDAIGKRMTSLCSSSGDCDGRPCRAGGRCEPPGGGLEQPGDAGRSFPQ